MPNPGAISAWSHFISYYYTLVGLLQSIVLIIKFFPKCPLAVPEKASSSSSSSPSKNSSSGDDLITSRRFGARITRCYRNYCHGLWRWWSFLLILPSFCLSSLDTTGCSVRKWPSVSLHNFIMDYIIIIFLALAMSPAHSLIFWSTNSLNMWAEV